MTRYEAVRSIKALTPELSKLGVRSVALFGSVSRDEAGPQSDLDLVAEFELPHTAKQYFDTLFLLEDALGVKVDLAEPNTLHPSLSDRVLAEAVLVA